MSMAVLDVCHFSPAVSGIRYESHITLFSLRSFQGGTLPDMLDEIEEFYMFELFAMTMRFFFSRSGWLFRAIATGI